MFEKYRFLTICVSYVCTLVRFMNCVPLIDFGSPIVK